MFLLSILIAIIMTLAALLHFYWAFGGTYGLDSAGPKLQGKTEFKPGRVLTFVVACLIVGLAVLAIQLERPWLPINDFAPYLGYCVSVLFIVRSIGDFRYIGFFKTIYNSSFSRLDSRYFSPLFLFLGISYAVLSIASSANAGDLKPFTSDGCSAFPDGTISQRTLWLKCCTEHDKAYWAGGTSAMRKRADKDLQVCVAKVGEPKIAQLMLAGVRVGGTPYLPTTFRWGYGWPFPRGYKVLTKEEKLKISTEMGIYEENRVE